MTSPSAVVPPDSVPALAQLLADVHVSLAVATSDAESLAAVMRYIEGQGPAEVRLFSTLPLAGEQPQEVELVSRWSAGRVKESDPGYGARYLLPSLLSPQLWSNNPHDLVLVEDVATDPRCSPGLRAQPAALAQRALVVLPLYSVGHASWQGVLWIDWDHPHPLSSAERFVYSMLMPTLAAALASRRLVERLEKTLREQTAHSSLLKAVVEQLPVGVFVAEVPSGRPTLANRRAVELLGRSIEPGAGAEAYVDTYRCVRPGTDIALSPEELPIVRTLGDSQLHRGELDVIAPSGQQRTLEVLSAPIFDPAGKMYSALAHFTDVTERRRAEREQLRMQQELITVQAAALAERSTPLIPIHDEIVVVPLIGSLDTERGSQLMEALLHGVGVNRARVAIIDITGVRTLDTLAASTLTSAAQALRLLGVEPVLTGIRAEVAQTLIGIGVRLDGITTRNNLQSGIAYALKLTGRPSLR